MAKQMKEIYSNVIGNYGGAAAKTGIVAATTGIEQLTTLAAYRCPCVSLAELGNCSINAIGSAACSQKLNIGYGLSFLLAPAVVLFVFGMATNPKMWKSFTGCSRKTKLYRRGNTDIMWTVLGVVGMSVIAPVTWVAIGLLDGRFYACAVTSLPYDVERPAASFKDCEAVAIAKIVYTSDRFNDNRSFSQLMGWISVGGGLTIGFFLYAVTQCISPLTYYHNKYYKLYREQEEAEFDDEMQQKAQKDAEENVRFFMKERRSKELWDQISTVYEFHRDSKKLALYSHLHEWVLKERKNENEGKPLLETGGKNADGESSDNENVIVTSAV